MQQIQLPEAFITRLYLDELRSYEEILTALKEQQGVVISVATLRRWLHREGIYQPRSERWKAYTGENGRWKMSPNLVKFKSGEEHPNYKDGKTRIAHLEPKRCLVCKTLFHPKVAKQKYCGPNCFYSNKRTSERIRKRCPECDKIVLTIADKREKTYCSTDCSMKVRVRANRKRHRDTFVSRVRTLHQQGYSYANIPKELKRRWPSYKRNQYNMSKSAISHIVRGD